MDATAGLNRLHVVVPHNYLIFYRIVVALSSFELRLHAASIFFPTKVMAEPTRSNVPLRTRATSQKNYYRNLTRCPIRLYDGACSNTFIFPLLEGHAALQLHTIECYFT